MRWGMGWMGWSEERTLQTTLPAIVQAYEGRVQMLEAIFGKQASPTEQVSSQPFSLAAFDAALGI